MNYGDQQRYLAQSRMWAIALAVLWVLVCAVSFVAIRMPFRSAIVLGLVVPGIAGSLLYTPDYLHLTVNPVKRSRWQIMIRWRILGIVLIVGLALCLSMKQGHRLKELIVLLVAVCWLISANLAARKRPGRSGLATFFWITDWAVLTALLFMLNYDALVIAGLLAVAAHFSMLGRDRQIFPWAMAVIISAWVPLIVASWLRGLGPGFFIVSAAIVCVPLISTAWLENRAQEQNVRVDGFHRLQGREGQAPLG